MKIEFFGALDIRFVDGEIFLLNQRDIDPFGVIIDDIYVVIPPDQFATDFLSIPSFGRWLIPKIGGKDKSGYAGVIHDYLYSDPGAAGTPANRKYADKVFKACLKKLGVSSWKTNIMYAAVRVGGWPVYGKPNRHNKESGVIA